VQRAVQTPPGLTSLLGVAYLTLHLTVTAGVLLWLHRRRPEGFPFVRTALLLASGLALVGFFVYPTAPPRLAGVGILDTVSGEHADLDLGLVSSLYNPYAAVPSMHVGYALIVAAGLLRHGRRLLVRAIGAVYPLFVLLVIDATGNHFFLAAAAGALVAALQSPGAAPEHIEYLSARGSGTQLGNGLADHNGCLVLGRGSATVVLTHCSRSGRSVTASTTCRDSTRPTTARSRSGSIPTRRGCRSTAPLKRCSSSSGGPSRSSGATRRACRTELGEGDIALTNPPAVEALRAGAEGASFLALASRG